jgi:hypothetical protein
MRPAACAKSDAMAHMRSGGADDRCVQSSGFIGLGKGEEGESVVCVLVDNPDTVAEV